MNFKEDQELINAIYPDKFVIICMRAYNIICEMLSHNYYYNSFNKSCNNSYFNSLVLATAMECR